MDPMLLALALDLQAKARKITQTDDLPMRFAALDMLDYLGRKIDENVKLKEPKKMTIHTKEKSNDNT